MLRFALFILIAGLAAGQAPPDKTPITKRLLKAMDVENMMRSSLRTMMASQRQAMSTTFRAQAASFGLTGTSSEKAMDLMLSKLHELILPELDRMMDTTAITDEIVVPVYNAAFDESELRALAEFYESPAGRKMVQNQPRMMQEISAAMGPRQQQMIGQLIMFVNERIPSLLEEVRTAYPDAFTPAPKPKSAKP